MKTMSGLSPTLQQWVGEADTPTLQAKYLEYSARREIKARDIEFLGAIVAGIADELAKRGEEIPEVPKQEEAQ